MKYRVIVKNNKYIPQWRDEKNCVWVQFLYPAEKCHEMHLKGINYVQYDTQPEVEEFIYREINNQDPDHQYVWKTYEA